MRTILFTGKGGVGKSTIAAATAVRTAAQGRRTLLVSSDLAHNLSDITDVGIGDSCVAIAENLHALEVDILNEVRENWAPIQEYMADITAFVGIDSAVAEEVGGKAGSSEEHSAPTIYLSLLTCPCTRPPNIYHLSPNHPSTPISQPQPNQYDPTTTT